MKTSKFDIFDVFQNDDKDFVFEPKCLLSNPPNYDSFLDYFFGADTCLEHFVSQYRRISFLKPNETKVKVRLYRCLQAFLNNARLYRVTDDKVGMFGDHCLSIILEKYFHADCLINKCVDLKTNPKMSVYGCDVLYYSKAINCFLFGEAKFTETVENGIDQIKDSLKDYEDRIVNEYNYVLTKCSDESALKLLGRELTDIIETTLDIKDAIKKAKMTCIYVPLFIMHGGELTPQTILSKISVLGKVNFLGIKTRYYVISLPVRDKVATFNEFEAYIDRKAEQLKMEIQSADE